jgi:hypothetical protein
VDCDFITSPSVYGLFRFSRTAQLFLMRFWREPITFELIDRAPRTLWASCSHWFHDDAIFSAVAFYVFVHLKSV